MQARLHNVSDRFPGGCGEEFDSEQRGELKMSGYAVVTSSSTTVLSDYVSRVTRFKIRQFVQFNISAMTINLQVDRVNCASYVIFNLYSCIIFDQVVCYFIMSLRLQREI